MTSKYKKIRLHLPVLDREGGGAKIWKDIEDVGYISQHGRYRKKGGVLSVYPRSKIQIKRKQSFTPVVLAIHFVSYPVLSHFVFREFCFASFSI